MSDFTSPTYNIHMRTFSFNHKEVTSHHFYWKAWVETISGMKYINKEAKMC